MDKNFLEEVKKAFAFDAKKMDVIKLGYYGAAIVLLIFPMYSVSFMGFSQSLSGFRAFATGEGFLYYIAIGVGIATLFVQSLKSYDDIAFTVVPVVVLVLMFIMNSSVTSGLKSAGLSGLVKNGLGFWGLILLNLAAVGYKWYPTVMKMINDKK